MFVLCVCVVDHFGANLANFRIEEIDVVASHASRSSQEDRARRMGASLALLFLAAAGSGLLSTGRSVRALFPTICHEVQAAVQV